MLFTNAILILAYLSSTGSGRLEIWASVGALFGLFLFFRGFQMLRHKRLILNTPASKTRSASMGLVEIAGMAKGPHTIPAGITGNACFYYRAMAWQLRESGKSSEWMKAADESLYVPFFVEDSTGRVLVNPQGAELDIHRDFKDEIGDTFFARPDMMSASVSAFLLRNGLAGSDRTRLEEYCIMPDYPLFVLGTLGTNALRGPWTPAAQTTARISLKSRLNPFGPAGNLGLQVLGVSLGITPETSLIQPSRVPLSAVAASSPRAPDSPEKSPTVAKWTSLSMDETAMATVGSAISRHASSVQPSTAVAVHEVAPLPLPPAPHVAAAPTVDANNFEVNPSVAIGEGTDGAPFSISWKSQREVVQSLAWKSTLCIWGGPTLTLACLYFLYAAFDWM